MLYLCLAGIFIGLLLFLPPVSLGYDSRENRVKVRWLGLTLTRELKKKTERPRKKVSKAEPKGPGWAVIRHMAGERNLAVELINKIGRLGRDLLGIISFKGSEAGFSLPDPKWNGMLYALLANIHLEGVALSTNFNQLNFVKVWVTFYPLQVTAKVMGWLAHLPLRRIIRLIWDIKKAAKQ